MEVDRSDRDDEADGGLYDAGGARLSDPAAEQTLLGFLLLQPAAIDDVVTLVASTDFADPFHRRIFECFERAHEEGWSVGPGTIVEALGGDPKAEIIDGMTAGGYMARLMSDADMSVDPQDVAVHIQECAERRAVGSADDISYPPSSSFVSQMGLKMWVDQNDPGPEYEFIVEDLIPEKQGIVLMGETQTGKSFLTFHLAMCLARGVPFFGRRILKQMGVVWLAYEAAQGATARMRAYRKHMGLDLEDLPFAALQTPAALWPVDQSVEDVIQEINHIARYKFNVPLGLVIIDTHNAATPGASEIDSEVASKIRANYHRMIAGTGASVLVVGHTNSSGKHRGNEQLTNNIDTIIKVSRKTTTEGREVIPLKDEDGREIRVMKVQKQREGLDGQSHEFVLRVVEDGTRNKYGKPRTSCVVVNPNISDVGDDAQPANGDASKQGWRVSANEALFLRCILQCQNDFGAAPPAELGLPRSIGLVVDYDYVKRLMFTKMLRDDDNTEEGRKRHRERTKSAIKRARTRLMHARIIGCHDPFIWWTGKPVRGIRETQKADASLFDLSDRGATTDQDFPDDI